MAAVDELDSMYDDVFRLEDEGRFAEAAELLSARLVEVQRRYAADHASPEGSINSLSKLSNELTYRARQANEWLAENLVPAFLKDRQLLSLVVADPLATRGSAVRSRTDSAVRSSRATSAEQGWKGAPEAQLRRASLSLAAGIAGPCLGGRHSLLHGGSLELLSAAPDEGLEVEQLLRALEGGMMRLLSQLGPITAAVMRLEERNLARLRTVSAAMRAEGVASERVVAVLDHELRRGQHTPGGDPAGTGATLGKPSAALALLWTRRTLHMCVRMLELLQCLVDARRRGGPEETAAPANPFAQALARAYAETLQPFHGWVLQRTFRLAINELTLPSYEQMLALLAPGAPSAAEREALVLAELPTYVEAGAAIVNELQLLYAERGLEDTSKI